MSFPHTLCFGKMTHGILLKVLQKTHTARVCIQRTSSASGTRMPTVNLRVKKRIEDVMPTHAMTARINTTFAPTAAPLPP